MVLVAEAAQVVPAVQLIILRAQAVLAATGADAVMIGLQSGKILSEPGARAALATALFRDGGLSLARGARMAQMPLSAFITHVSRLGIPVVSHDASDIPSDMETLDQWLASS